MADRLLTWQVEETIATVQLCNMKEQVIKYSKLYILMLKVSLHIIVESLNVKKDCGLLKEFPKRKIKLIFTLLSILLIFILKTFIKLSILIEQSRAGFIYNFIKLRLTNPPKIKCKQELKKIALPQQLFLKVCLKTRILTV